MGRKDNNKKRARAARSAAAQVQSTPGTTAIRSLRGIISTNDDPYRCHGCSNSFDFNDLMIGAHDWRRTSICCGKMFCCDCAKADKCQSAMGVACSSCGGVLTTLKLPRARAKKGHLWAQFALAWQLWDESIPEARKWCLKAAKGGHPFAFVRLAEFHLYRQHFNAAKVKEFLGEAMEIFLSSELMFDFSVTLHVANELRIGSDIKDGVKFMQHALLVPLAKKGLRGAQYQLSVAIAYLENDLSVALDLARKAAVRAGAPRLEPGAPAILAADCCKKLDRAVEGLFWLKQHAIAEGCSIKKRAERAHSELCEMRKSCSACGVALDVSNRKLCAGCKISCYCSRECQKVHWSRPDDGHRDQCKTIVELVEEIKEEKKKE